MTGVIVPATKRLWYEHVFMYLPFEYMFQAPSLIIQSFDLLLNPTWVLAILKYSARQTSNVLTMARAQNMVKKTNMTRTK